jgi:hypothetical protein
MIKSEHEEELNNLAIDIKYTYRYGTASVDDDYPFAILRKVYEMAYTAGVRYGDVDFQ